MRDAPGQATSRSGRELSIQKSDPGRSSHRRLQHPPHPTLLGLNVIIQTEAATTGVYTSRSTPSVSGTGRAPPGRTSGSTPSSPPTGASGASSPNYGRGSARSRTKRGLRAAGLPLGSSPPLTAKGRRGGPSRPRLPSVVPLIPRHAWPSTQSSLCFHSMCPSTNRFHACFGYWNSGFIRPITRSVGPTDRNADATLRDFENDGDPRNSTP